LTSSLNLEIPSLLYLTKSASPSTFRIKFIREDFSPNGYRLTRFVFRNQIPHPHTRRVKALASICSRLSFLFLNDQYVTSFLRRQESGSLLMARSSKPIQISGIRREMTKIRFCQDLLPSTQPEINLRA